MTAVEDMGQSGRVPKVGALVRDTRRDRVGVVMATLGTYVQLRPLMGGLEWDVRPGDIRTLTAREELSARLKAQDALREWHGRIR